MHILWWAGLSAEMQTVQISRGALGRSLHADEAFAPPVKRPTERIPEQHLCRRVYQWLRNVVFLPWWEWLWVFLRGRHVYTDEWVCILSEVCWCRCLLVWVLRSCTDDEYKVYFVCASKVRSTCLWLRSSAYSAGLLTFQKWVISLFVCVRDCVECFWQWKVISGEFSVNSHCLWKCAKSFCW